MAKSSFGQIMGLSYCLKEIGLMTTTEMIFDGLVWLIGGLVVIYMSKRYWVMFRQRNKPSSGSCNDQSSCSSCPSKKQ
jgi:hypothetical protein